MANAVILIWCRCHPLFNINTLGALLQHLWTIILLGSLEVLLQLHLETRSCNHVRENLCAWVCRGTGNGKKIENKSANFRTPKAERKTRNSKSLGQRKRYWLPALTAKGCPYESLPFPEQPDPVSYEYAHMLLAMLSTISASSAFTLGRHYSITPPPQRKAHTLLMKHEPTCRDLLGVSLHSQALGAGWGHPGA